MHISHLHTPLPGGIGQMAGLQSANSRKPIDKRKRRVEDSDDSLLDIVILSDREQEDRDEDPEQAG